jgi:tetratricopeptide (TPR) repeat protein
MKHPIFFLICAGVFYISAIAEDICAGGLEANDHIRASQCYVQQLKKEKSFNNFINAGISFYSLGRYTEALKYLKEAEHKARTLNEYRVMYSFLGGTYGALDDSDQEFVYNMKSLQLSLKSGESKDIGTAYENLGGWYIKSNQDQKALEYYEKALEYQKESERAYTYGNMAILYENNNDIHKAEEMLKKAVEINEKNGSHKDLGFHKAKLGKFYFNQQRYDEAYSTLENARMLSHQSGNISNESYVLSTLARIDYLNGKINQAREKVAEALRLAEKSGSKTIYKVANEVSQLVNKN